MEINAYRPEVYSHNVWGRASRHNWERGEEGKDWEGGGRRRRKHLSVSQKIAALIARYVIATKFCKDFKLGCRNRVLV